LIVSEIAFDGSKMRTYAAAACFLVSLLAGTDGLAAGDSDAVAVGVARAAAVV